MAKPIDKPCKLCGQIINVLLVWPRVAKGVASPVLPEPWCAGCRRRNFRQYQIATAEYRDDKIN